MNSWSMVTLASLTDGEPGSFVDGPFGSELKTTDYVDAGVPLIRIQNVRANRYVASGIRYISDRKAAELHRHNYRPGDLVITKLGDPCGVACVLPEEAGCGIIVADIVRFRGDRKRVDLRFLSHYLNSPAARSQLDREAKGTTRQRINLSSFKSLNVPLPELREQQRIADVLDRAEALRAQRRAALALLDTLTESLFYDVFGDPATNPRGWVVAAVGEVADVQGGLQLSSARRELPLEVPYLRVANVFRGRVDLREVKLIRASASEVARTTLMEGDLLIVEGHGNPEEIGRCAVWDGSIPNCVHQNHLIRARFDQSRVLPGYASYFLNSPGGRTHLIRSGKTTSGLNTISVSDVRRVPIAVPPLALQQRFARQSASVAHLVAKQAASAARLDELFASLQHRAFRGELWG